VDGAGRLCIGRDINVIIAEQNRKQRVRGKDAPFARVLKPSVLRMRALFVIVPVV